MLLKIIVDMQMNGHNVLKKLANNSKYKKFYSLLKILKINAVKTFDTIKS